MKKIVKPAVVFALVALLAVPGFAGELEEQLDEANNRQEELQAEVANSQARLEELQNSKADIEEKIAEIDAEIAQVDALIAEYSDEADSKEVLIDELENTISSQEDDLAAKYEKMKIRIKYMYENLDANYIEAIFTSSSFGEFFEKVEYISALNQYDRRMMDEIETLNKELKANKETVEEELQVVRALGDAQEEQKTVLDDLQVMKSTELANTEVAIVAEVEEIQALNAMLEENAGQIAALSAEYDEWLASGGGAGTPDPEAEEAARQAEEEAERLAREAAEAEEAARQAEEEAARRRQEVETEPVEPVEPETDEYGNVIDPVEQETQAPEVIVDPEAEQAAEEARRAAEEAEAARQAAEEEAARRRQEAENSGGGGGGGAGVPNGYWIWPVPGYTSISSGFGPRDGGYHYGIDIPAPEGTPVIAVDGGKVVMARWSPGADTGIYVVIYHGGTYSEYMHLSGMAVSEGQLVSQGDVIGYVGNTGQSYGAHLHLSASAGTQYWLNRFAPPF